MDDFFIQEEVVVKTESGGLPDDDDLGGIPLNKIENSIGEDVNNIHDYPENVEQFLLDGTYNRDLMVYLKCPEDTLQKDIKKENYESLYNNGSDEGMEKTVKQSPSTTSTTTRKKATKTRTPRTRKSTARSVVTYECSICMYITGTQDGLKSHMLAHIGGPDTDTFIEESLVGDIYKCFFCPFSSRTKTLFADHLKHSHENNRVPSSKYEPRGAGIYSDSDSDDDDEDSRGSSDSPKLQISSSKKNYSCLHCKFTAKNYEKYKAHSLIHANDTLKGKEAKRKRKPNAVAAPNAKPLESYKAIHDKDGKRYYPCAYCDFRGTHRFRIIRHERIHTGEKPYACHHCSFRCNQEGTLKIHIRRHTGERPYECNRCSFKTISRSSLTSHEKIHSSSRDVVCPECGLGFANERTLKRHEKTHLANGQSPSSSPKKKKRGPPPSAAARKVFQKKAATAATSSTSANRTYKCSLCDFKCSKFLELNEHTNVTHKVKEEGVENSNVVPPRDKYQCSVCGFKCSKKKELRAHIRHAHGIMKKQEAKEVTIKIGGYLLKVTDE